MYCSAIASVPIFSWMNVTRSFSFSSLVTSDACAMPSDASSVSDLTSSGYCSSFGRAIRRFAGNTRKRGAGTR